jgi:hypothetical protein
VGDQGFKYPVPSTPYHAERIRVDPFSLRVPAWYSVLGTWYVILILALCAASAAFAAAPQKLSKDQIKKGDLADKSKSIDMTPALQDYCRLLYGCNLKVPEGYCPSTAVLGPAPIVYDNERCSEAREFSRRGVGPDHPVWGFKLYRFLGYEYRVTYEISDTLPISRERLEYLVGDVPLAAKLVSYYQKNPYTAEYVDFGRTHFKGTNGKHLRGEAKVITGSYMEKHLYYMGSGVAEWGFWTLVGPAMMDFEYWEVPGREKKIGYKVKILVFPGNGVINSIMNLGVFRGLVKSKINGVLTDISETAQKMEKSGGKELKQSSAWSGDEKKKIETLLSLP